MKTLETARTADCCDPTGGRLRSPVFILFFFRPPQSLKTTLFPLPMVRWGWDYSLLPWRAHRPHTVRSRFSRPGAALSAKASDKPLTGGNV